MYNMEQIFYVLFQISNLNLDPLVKSKNNEKGFALTLEDL